MDFQEFKGSLDQENPPNVEPLLAALWYDGKGNWDKAHSIVQELNGTEACWIHAYLHRKEGDIGNAGYWYNRAGKAPPETDLQVEWKQLVDELM